MNWVLTNTVYQIQPDFCSVFDLLTPRKLLLIFLFNEIYVITITKLLNKMNTLSKNNNIILTWIPSYIGIHGNKKTDKTAN